MTDNNLSWSHCHPCFRRWCVGGGALSGMCRLLRVFLVANFMQMNHRLTYKVQWLTSQLCNVMSSGSSSDDIETHSDTLSPSSTKPRGMQRTKPRALRSGAGPSTGAAGGTGGRSIIQCLMCQKTFNNSSALAKHKLIHSDERKYACTLCSKAFKRQDHL